MRGTSKQDSEPERQAANRFGAIYEEHYDAVRAYLRRRLPQRHLAEDLASEVFEVALRSIGSFRPERGTHRQWLLGIARHRLIRFWRVAARAHDVQERLANRALPAPSPDGEPHRRVEGRSAVERLRRELEKLPPTYRAAIEQRFYADGRPELRNYADVAQSLGCSATVARVRVHRALATLRARLALRPEEMFP